MRTEDSMKPMYYDHEPGQYCMDKALSTTEKKQQVQYAMVCTPEKVIRWTDTDFLIRKIINPLFHGIAMIILLTIAIIYFVLPTLRQADLLKLSANNKIIIIIFHCRDLVGNIVTTITVCLIVGQAADLVRIFTEFSSHVSFLIAGE